MTYFPGLEVNTPDVTVARTLVSAASRLVSTPVREATPNPK
jgi:hypothetical protein